MYLFLIPWSTLGSADAISFIVSLPKYCPWSVCWCSDGDEIETLVLCLPSWSYSTTMNLWPSFNITSSLPKVAVIARELTTRRLKSKPFIIFVLDGDAQSGLHFLRRNDTHFA
ncbi:hypothetical protein ES332_D13G151000v1 [Gossypium tomentosum]|uniref:Copine C-terminal domain-containing protein n=1 Tax=Gossypium tomentosum TaxID=34277 RepID=A0A5D2HX47_GOSTO|nr:hypothetical protein ES332_D13G151000v1 [Gossypium tomentosum]